MKYSRRLGGLRSNVIITGDNVPDMNLSVNSKGKLTTTLGRIKQTR